MLQGEHSAILSTFIKLPFVIQIFVSSIFEWPLKTCFTHDFNLRARNKILVFLFLNQNTVSMRRFFWAPKTYVKTDG